MLTLPAQTLVSAITFLLLIQIVLGTVAYLGYAERKGAAYIQDRIGPNRVGFDFGLKWLKPLRGMWGLGQSIADGIKFLVKEDYSPDNVDKRLFTLAPILVLVPALIGIAIIPWGGTWIIEDDIHIFGLVTFQAGPVVVAGLNVDAGIIYLLAVASLGVYGVTLAGWSSNNKYSFLGGLRATAQMISYEIPIGLMVIAVLLMVGSLLPGDILAHQREHGWLMFAQPMAALIFFIAILAEGSRLPFDNTEAEQELVGGYHTEYSSMRFLMFMLAEFAHVITASAFFVLLFLGGWSIMPFVDILPEEATGLGGLLIVGAKFGVFFSKTLAVVLFMILIRWTIPRLRYDQVMMMAWQTMIPLSLVVVVVTAVMVYLRLDTLVPMLIANGVLFALFMGIYPLLPRAKTSRRIPLYGSRFNPVEGERVVAQPQDPQAREDHPIRTAMPAN